MTIDVDDSTYEVAWKYHPPTRGARDSLGGVWGAGLEPDEPAEVEITDVTLHGVQIDYDEALWNRLEAAIWEEIEQGYGEPDYDC
jgi:hypothetical protein